MNISNYGVKKMLPRLIVAAIVVNVSYYLCQIAVDISNIVGSSVYEMLVNMKVGTGTTAGGPSLWESMVGMALASAAVVVLVIAICLAPMVLLSFLVVLLILVARQALVILLVVISPLAFVAYILPNTEQLFKRWWKMFIATLVVFPVVGLVFGASALASKILLEVATGGNDPTGLDDDKQMLALVAMAVAAIPLFAIPSILKGSLNATGAIGAKIQGFANKRQEAAISNSRLGAYKKAFDRNKEIRRAQVHGGVYRGRNPLLRADSALSRFSNRYAGKVGTQVAQQGASLANKLEVENVQAASAQIQQANLDNNALSRLANGERVQGINGSDASTRAAAMEALVQRGEYSSLQQAWNGVVDGDDNETKRIVAQSMSRSSNKPTFMSGGDLQALSEGGSNATLRLESMAARGGDRYSSDSIAEAPAPELDFVISNGGHNASVAMQQAAANALGHQEIAKKIGNTRGQITVIANGRAPTPTP